jgi:hypothetical protein
VYSLPASASEGVFEPRSKSDVGAAVAEARTAVKMGSALEWGTPVLYMRSEDGLIFDIPSEGRHEQPPGATEILLQYRELIESAWTGEDIDARQAEQLGALANELGLNSSAAAEIEREVMGETKEAILDRQEQLGAQQYRKALEEAWADNKLSNSEAKWLGTLASELGLSTDTVADIEHDIVGDTIPAILRRHRRLDELYARARRLHQDQEWQMVVEDFERIRSEDPAFPDPERLLASAREALDRGRKVAALYDQASRYVDGRQAASLSLSDQAFFDFLLLPTRFI